MYHEARVLTVKVPKSGNLADPSVTNCSSITDLMAYKTLRAVSCVQPARFATFEINSFFFILFSADALVAATRSSATRACLSCISWFKSIFTVKKKEYNICRGDRPVALTLYVSSWSIPIRYSRLLDRRFSGQ